jgi:cytochrome c-type biogenesis protein
MTLELTAIPLAFVAGILSILSPCVWPLVPMVMASSANTGRWGPVFLALGLSLSFTLAGGVLTFLLLNAGLSPDAFRWFGAAMLVLIGLILVVKPLGDAVTNSLSRLSSRFNLGGSSESATAFGQLGVGIMLGLVWLPCVGPTLGAAIALASFGQELGMASIVLFLYGLGSAVTLIVTAKLSQHLIRKVRPELFSKVGQAKMILGWIMLILGIMVFTGLDKVLETLAVQFLPIWAFSI